MTVQKRILLVVAFWNQFGLFGLSADNMPETQQTPHHQYSLAHTSRQQALLRYPLAQDQEVNVGLEGTAVQMCQ